MLLIGLGNAAVDPGVERVRLVLWIKVAFATETLAEIRTAIRDILRRRFMPGVEPIQYRVKIGHALGQRKGAVRAARRKGL